jgi:hypothetical protein
MIPTHSIAFYSYIGGTQRNDVELIELQTKSRLTESIGTFVATVKSEENFNVGLFDRVEIKLGWSTLPSTNTFVGKVTGINSQVGDAKVKIISGLDLGEILLRRFKSTYYWNKSVHDIADEFRTDLGLSDEIEDDDQIVEVLLAEDSYFDALQKISDYWISPSVQVKKDFYVDVDGKLAYRNRSPPWRTTGVETLEFGENLFSYSCNRSLEKVKNWIKVYGDWDKLYEIHTPADENWTESLTNWNLEYGNGLILSTPGHAGTYYLSAGAKYTGSDYECLFSRSFSPEFCLINGVRKNAESFSRILHHAMTSVGTPPSAQIRLWAPDSSNYFSHDFGVYAGGVWDPTPSSIDFGEGSTGWGETGNPVWDHLTRIQFRGENNINFDLNIDELFLTGGKLRSEVTDSTSLAAYGRRELVHSDEKLITATQCTARAQTILYQRKDPVTELSLTCRGSNNILLGDELPITLPLEGFASEPFYVVGVDHLYSVSENGWYTVPSLVSSMENHIQHVAFEPVREISVLKQRVNKLSNPNYTPTWRE